MRINISIIGSRNNSAITIDRSVVATLGGKFHIDRHHVFFRLVGAIVIHIPYYRYCNVNHSVGSDSTCNINSGNNGIAVKSKRKRLNMSGISARAFSICFYTASRHGNITEATETGKSKVRQKEVANAIAVVGDGDGSSSVIGESFAIHIYIEIARIGGNRFGSSGG